MVISEDKLCEIFEEEFVDIWDEYGQYQMWHTLLEEIIENTLYNEKLIKLKNDKTITP